MMLCSYLTPHIRCTVWTHPLLVILILISHHLVPASFLHSEVTSSPFVFDWNFVQGYWRRHWQPTPVLLPGNHWESDAIEVA